MTSSDSPSLSVLGAGGIYQRLAEGSSDVLLLAVDGVMRWLSPSLTQALGYQPDEWVGRRFEEFTHPDDVALAQQRRAEIRAGASTTTRLRVRDKHGAWHWVDVHAGLAAPAEGEQYGIVGSVRLVDDLVAADQDRLDSETQLRTILDALLDPHALLVPVRDSDGHVIDFVYGEINPAACRYLGLQREDLQGSRLLERFPGHRDSGLFDRYRECLETGEAMHLADVAILSDVAHEPRWFDFSGTRAGDAVALTWRDVSTPHLLLARARESEARFRMLAEHSGDIVMSSDATGALTFVSPAVRQVLGWSPDDLLGTSPSALVHPDDRSDVVGLIAEMRSTSDPLRAVRVRTRTADGNYRWVSSVARDLLGYDGALVGTVATWRDVDDEVEVERALETERALLRSVLDSMLDPHVVMTAVRDKQGAIVDFRYDDANPTALAYLGGLQREAFVGTTLREMYPSDAATLLLTQYAHTVDTGEALVLDDYAYPNEMFGGVELHYDLRGVRIGESLSLTWRDVTGTHKVRRLLTESIESSPDPTALQEAVRDRHGRVVDFRFLEANRAMCQFFGKSRGEVVGHLLTEVQPETDPARIALYGEVAESGESLVWDDVSFTRYADGAPAFVDFRCHKVGDGIAVVLRDSAERHRAARQLADSEERYRLLAENTSDVVLQISLDGTILWASSAAARTLAWDPSDLVGRTNVDLVHPEDRGWLKRAVQRAAQGAEATSLILRMERGDGTYVWVESAGQTADPGDGREPFRVVRLRDVDRQVRLQAELEQRARTDALTGLLTRREGWRRLGADLDERRHGSGVAVLFIDLDGFKSVNDVHGHQVGDTLLVALAARLTGAVRDDDYVVRVGGDELLVVLNGVDGMDAALQVAEKIRSAVALPVSVDDIPVSITASVGAALAHDDDTVSELVHRADRAMYVAKSTGKDQVVPIA